MLAIAEEIMKLSDEYRLLGMGREITRRDFLNGVAIGVTGAYLAGAGSGLAAAQNAPSPDGATEYPPLRSQLRGNYPEAVAEFDNVRAGRYAQFPVPADEIKEEYDLVIVGGGISGLSAAHFYRTALGDDQKILILDNHDDFGGHAKRNEFHYQGKTFIGYGGTMAVATPFPYSYTAKSLLKELGIDVGRYSEFVNHDLETKYHLSAATFFDKERFGEDRVVTGMGRRPWKEFFADAPLTEAARADLIRLHGKNPDYMSGQSVEEKKSKLAKISYQDYLLNIAKISPNALPFFMGEGQRNNKRVDTLPALEAAEHGSIGFNGLGLGLEESYNEGSFFFHFPDGNASIARLLVGKLIPKAMPPLQTMNTVIQASFDYAQLDREGAATHIRLGSPVLRVEHEGSPDSAARVRIAYRKAGKVYGVRARHCILACYNRLIPALMPEIPARQKEALEYPVKVPMMYTNVLLKKWTAFQKIGASRFSAPGMPYTYAYLDPGTTVGGYSGATVPEEPILVHMMANPNKPGLPRKEQNRIGQEELLSMTFEQFELQVRRQLSRMLATAGFNAAEDIAAITVNRWPYGYAYTYDTLADPEMPPEQRPHILGRQRFGLVSIANSDAGAAAFTNQAIDEANRAVQEILVAQGLT
jgi:spermidine dehydrogenase